MPPVLSQPVVAVIFEGGRPRTSLDEEMVAVRKAVVLDTIEKMGRVADIDEVILCTNYGDLAEGARALGAWVDFRRKKFHFGQRLLDVIERYGLQNVIYMGGAAAPLLDETDLRFLAGELKQRKNVVIQNNVQSPDVVAFTPAQVLASLPLPDNDNALGFVLRDVGLERVLLPNSARVNFDIDTPTDVMVLRLVGKAGARTAQVLESLDWDDSRLRAAWAVLEQPGAEVIVAGRVGPSLVTYLNMNIPVRVRVFSEERGMKALGRQDRGEVRSLLGLFYDRLGGRELLSCLAECGQALFCDSRVLFAHWRRRVTDWDRFQSDLGRYDLVKDPVVADFTRAVAEAPFPVVLGGHCLVSGGLWLLAEALLHKIPPWPRDQLRQRESTH